MKLVAIISIVLLLVAGLAGIALYRFFRVVRQTERVEVGPFTIQADAATGKTFNINFGLVDSTTVAYSIWFDEQPIRAPEQLESNSGLPFLWKVYEVRGTSEPTLIAGSQSLFMVKIKNGQPVITPIHKQYSDFATLQFLDSEAGQPGMVHTVCMSNSEEDMGQIEVLEGGRLLLVCGLNVLDIETGELWSFSTQGRSLDNYSFPSPHDAGALAFSPDQRSIVFHGAFQTWNKDLSDFSRYAMVVFDFRTDKGYVLPYNDNELRLTSFANVNQEWFASRFEWVKSDAGHDVIQLRPHEHPYPWLGQYKPQDNYYVIYPVEPEMLQPFLDFVLTQLGWTREAIVVDETKIYAGRTITLENNGIKLDVNFREDERQISFSKHLYLSVSADDATYTQIVQRIAEAFNQKLTQGEYQQYFGETLSSEY